MKQTSAQNSNTDIKQIFQDLTVPKVAPNSISTDTYLRSGIYTAQTGINPLITAAQPILSMADRLQRSQRLPAPEDTRNSLTHELQAFEAHALTFEYQEDLILAARFILCVTLDDLLNRINWPDEASWQPHRLLPKDELTHQSPDDAFFLLLERVKQTPEIYIDLIELIYLCLSQGFAGKYQYIEGGKQNLDEILDAVYDTIRDQRGDVEQHLFHGKIPQHKAKTPHKTHRFMIFFIVCVCIIISLYFSLDYLLDVSASSTVDKLAELSHDSQFNQIIL